MSKNVSNIKNESLKNKPPSWKVETTPFVTINPRQANYYRRVFDMALFRRAVWQYMFGGILRSIFGIYSHSKYWDRKLEEDLAERMKKDYEESKRKGDYGIYTLQLRKATSFYGHLWINGQPPKPGKQKKKALYAKRGGIVYARVVKVASMTYGGYVDIEFKPVGRTWVGRVRILENTILRMPYSIFKWQVKNGNFKRMNDGKIYNCVNAVYKSRGTRGSQQDPKKD